MHQGREQDLDNDEDHGEKESSYISEGLLLLLFVFVREGDRGHGRKRVVFVAKGGRIRSTRTVSARYKGTRIWLAAARTYARCMPPR